MDHTFPNYGPSVQPMDPQKMAKPLYLNVGPWVWHHIAGVWVQPHGPTENGQTLVPRRGSMGVASIFSKILLSPCL